MRLRSFDIRTKLAVVLVIVNIMVLETAENPIITEE